MIALMLLSSPSLADDSPEAYERHLELLDDLRDRSPRTTRDRGLGFAATPTPVFQIDEGVVTLTSNGIEMGTIFGETVDTPVAQGETFVEHWIVSPSFAEDAGAPFELEMIKPKASLEWTFEYLKNNHEDWLNDAYSAPQFAYTTTTTPPTSTQGQQFTYGGSKIERHAFVLVQSTEGSCGDYVGSAWTVPSVCFAGAMLRERHINDGNTTKIVEHWLFDASFSMLDEEGETLRVVAVSDKPPATTGAFFAKYNIPSIEWYTQTDYTYDLSPANFPIPID
ncbi:MAG: hypothetical protein AAGA48_17410 [Myxococcota bacterium]